MIWMEMYCSLEVPKYLFICNDRSRSVYLNMWLRIASILVGYMFLKLNVLWSYNSQQFSLCFVRCFIQACRSLEEVSAATGCLCVSFQYQLACCSDSNACHCDLFWKQNSCPAFDSQVVKQEGIYSRFVMVLVHMFPFLYGCYRKMDGEEGWAVPKHSFFLVL
jgi:hypothetical protein